MVKENPVCAEAVELVKKFEGLELEAYLCPAGVPTIGYGHTEDVEMGQPITAKEAEAFLGEDLAEAAAAVDRLFPGLGPNKRGALASFVFNLGSGSLAGSTLLKLMRKRAPEQDIADQFDLWVKAKGKVLPGLVARRASEKELFLKEDADVRTDFRGIDVVRAGVPSGGEVASGADKHPAKGKPVWETVSGGGAFSHGDGGS